MKRRLFTLFAAVLGMCATLQAQNVTIDRTGWRITAYSNATTQIENAADGRANAAIDGNSATWYHSDWSGSKTGSGMPQAFLIDMAEEHDLTGFNYQGRTDKTDGTKPTAWRVYLYNEESKMPFGAASVSSSATISFISEIEAFVPLSLCNFRLVLFAIILASVVLPVPDGP